MERSRACTHALLVLAIAAVSACGSPQVASVAPGAPELPPEPAPLLETSPKPCQRILRIEVRKSERLLIAQCEGGGARSIPVALGRGSRYAKVRAGDQRTPEGHYRIRGEARSSRFHRFLAFDYPSPDDADRAFSEGLITDRDHRRILEAHENGRLPPGDTSLGGAMGFHGEGRRWRGDSADLDWTHGCIAMTDAEIDFLVERVEPGTPVWIHP